MPNPSSLTSSTVGQICITAKNLDRAVDFYQNTLGFRYLFTAGTMAFFDCNGVRLMLGIPNKPELDHPSSIVYFKVPNIQATHDELAAEDVVFELKPFKVAKMPGHDLWMAFFKDSEGNSLALMSEVPHSTQ